jgi:hypothetical protein
MRLEKPCDRRAGYLESSMRVVDGLVLRIEAKLPFSALPEKCSSKLTSDANLFSEQIQAFYHPFYISAHQRIEAILLSNVCADTRLAKGR